MIQYLMDRSAEMGRALTEAQARLLCAYQDMVVEANRTMNLTRVPEDKFEAADRNFLDSLAPWLYTDWLNGARSLIDIGAGAGFPGVPLAIVMPEANVTLLDSLGKKVDFLNGAIREMGLTNVEAVHFRAEEAGKTAAFRERYDAVTARAVAALPTLLELTLPFARVGGALIAYHGPKAEVEIPACDEALMMLGGGTPVQLPAPIPGRDWDHRLVRVEKRRQTPKRYPRKPGEPGRNPLGGGI